MSSIKKFFEKKKAEFKFKKAGPGHKLSQNPTASKPNRNLPSGSGSREEPTADVKRAGAAALARFQQNEKSSASQVMAGRSISVIRAEAKQELEREKNITLNAGVKSCVIDDLSKARKELDSAPVLAVNGVYFKCPLVGEEVLPRNEMEIKIKEFLFDQMNEDQSLAASLIIHTCNKNKEKVKICIETMIKYLDNILTHPNEEKYCKIKLSNKVFQERITSVEGAVEFLKSCGFQNQLIDVSDGVQEEFLVFMSKGDEDIDMLTTFKESLLAAEPILPELDRSLRVLKLIKSTSVNLPPDFFNISKEELKREQEIRTQQVELDTQLRTKAMREKQEIREKFRYKYTLLRIRFPNNIYLQGTFRVREKISDLKNFIQENLESDWIPFNLTSSTGQVISDDDSLLVDLQLVPAAVLHFSWDTSVMNDIQAQGNEISNNYLNPEIMSLLEEI